MSDSALRKDSPAPAAQAAAPLLRMDRVEKTFRQAGHSLTILQDISFSIGPGEMTALVGQSGAGKSTLLHMAGLLDRPTTGKVSVGGREAGNLGDSERTALRRAHIGFVYQFHYLQPEFSALENVVLPQMIAGKKKKDAEIRAKELLDQLGLGHRLGHRPARLSGGEQQRVAIARALANRPRVLLADEPTGNLDNETAAEVFALLVRLVRQSGIGALIATHNMDLASQMDRVFYLKSGRLQA